jgi:hypothetical protein
MLMAASMPRPTAAPRWHFWLMLVPWLAGVLLYATLAWMVHFGVAHPHFLPVLGLVALLVISSSFAMLVGSWRLLRGPMRLCGLSLVTVASLPLALFAFHVSWLSTQPEVNLRIDGGYRLRVLLPLAASLMDLEARFRYPERTVGRKVVMIHAGIPDAPEEVEAMDRHVEKMERLLGTETPGKVHWVRGSLGLLGISRMHLWGVALGSEWGTLTREADGLSSLDRHEVAHWTIDGHYQLYQAPRPIILAEGWAETQSGYPRLEIFSLAAKYREEGSWLPLQELIVPGRKDYNYGVFNARSYFQGRVLVDYLLSQYGGPAFFAFYHDCTAQTFESDCRRHFGLDIAGLEAAYTQHLDKTIASHGSLLQWRLEEMACGEAVDPAKWLAFVHKYVAAHEPWPELNARFTVVMKVKSGTPPFEESNWQCDFGVSGPFAAKMESSTDSSQSLDLAHPSGTWSIVREAVGQPWISRSHSLGSIQAYQSQLRSLRHDAVGWLKQPLYENDTVFHSGLPKVTELVEFEEEGQPRLRITIESLPRSAGLPESVTQILAVNQSYVPIRTEIKNNFHQANIVRMRHEYDLIDGKNIRRRYFYEVLEPDGQLMRQVSTEIKDCQFGPISPDYFALKSFGLTESEIVDKSDNASEESTQVGQHTGFRRWMATLPWWITGWILFCLATWLLRNCAKKRNAQASKSLEKVDGI